MLNGPIKKKKGHPQNIFNRILRRLESKTALVRASAVESLENIEHPGVVPELIRALSDSSPIVRSSSAECLGRVGGEEAVKPLIARLSDHFREVRMRAAEALGSILQDQRQCPSALLQRLRDPDELVRIEVAEALGAIGDRRALPYLWRAINDQSALVRSYIVGAIGVLGTKADVAKLEQWLEKERSETAKIGYYQALHELGQRQVLPKLVQLLESRDYRVRCATSQVLCRIASRPTVPVILDALRKALKKETTVAGKESIRSSIRSVSQEFR